MLEFEKIYPRIDISFPGTLFTDPLPLDRGIIFLKQLVLKPSRTLFEEVSALWNIAVYKVSGFGCVVSETRLLRGT